jgi:signal peptidase I
VSAALVIRHFVIEAYQIPNTAMKPTLVAGDTIFAIKWPYWFKKDVTPERGDIVIFNDQSTEDPSNELNLIRRVIGLPGDTVAVENGMVILNGKRLADEASFLDSCSKETLPSGKSYSICLNIPIMDRLAPKTVPANSVFVITDQRSSAGSKSRRPWAIIPISSIKAKALYTWLSIQPSSVTQKSESWFPHIRFERMFRRIQ